MIFRKDKMKTQKLVFNNFFAKTSIFYDGFSIFLHQDKQNSIVVVRKDILRNKRNIITEMENLEFA